MLAVIEKIRKLYPHGVMVKLHIHLDMERGADLYHSSLDVPFLI